MADKEELESLCKRRGFIWQSSEIYSGEAGFYDYAHLGAKIKDNWERLWKRFFIEREENHHMIYTPNILPYRALEASGHVDHFSDVLIECERCGQSYRGDHLIEESTGEGAEWMGIEEIKDKIEELSLSCPNCGGTFSDPRDFNMMFSVSLGPTGERKGFLRPETAQGTYMNFRREFRALRKEMPLGLATMGRAFRNEISPRQGVFRQREFIQAELQIFFLPGVDDSYFEERYQEEKDRTVKVKRADDKETREIEISRLQGLPDYYRLYLSKMYQFFTEEMGLDKDHVRFRELPEEERAFYNKIHFDIEIDFDSLGGWKEVAGLHYRGDYDLSRHEKESGQKMSVPTESGREIPHVIELSFGVDRSIWASLDLGYRTGERDWMDLVPKLSPYQVAVFPLVRKDGLPEKSREVFEMLQGDVRAFWDKSGSIGKRYARQDEIGTPYCVTIDYDTMEEDTVTVRDIRTKEQIRVSTDELIDIIRSLIDEDKYFEEYNK